MSAPHVEDLTARLALGYSARRPGQTVGVYQTGPAAYTIHPVVESGPAPVAVYRDGHPAPCEPGEVTRPTRRAGKCANTPGPGTPTPCQEREHGQRTGFPVGRQSAKRTPRRPRRTSRSPRSPRPLRPAANAATNSRPGPVPASGPVWSGARSVGFLN